MRRLAGIDAEAEQAALVGVDWASEAKLILKSELKRRDMTYADLVRELAVIGVHETEPNIRNKISRGTFTAAFMLQCLAAARCAFLDLTLMYGERRRGD